MPYPLQSDITSLLTTYQTTGFQNLASALGLAVQAAYTEATLSLRASELVANGGSAPPGGPIAGAKAVIAPGNFKSTYDWSSLWSKLSLNPTIFSDPSNLLELFKAVSSSLQDAWSGYVTGLAGSVDVIGGVAAYVPPTPPAVPAGTPGTLTGATIVPTKLSSLSSVGSALYQPNTLSLAVEAALPPLFRQQEGKITPQLKGFLDDLSNMFSTVHSTWTDRVFISNSTVSGTVSPPSGLLTGGVGSVLGVSQT